MLVLGLQVLLGFDFQSFLMKRWDALSPGARTTKLVLLALLLSATVLLLLPAARHRMVDDGEDREETHRFTRRVMTAALLPFALALGADVYVVTTRVADGASAVAAGAVTAAAAILAWYALPFARRAPRAGGTRAERGRSSMEDEETKLNEKIRHVLTEARVVLPGTQALLGFQLAGFLQEGFDALPRASRLMQLVGLAFLGASVVLLMLPAVYHRIAERGEISERLHRVAGRCVLLGMVALAFAIGADTFVVVWKGTASLSVAIVSAVAWLGGLLFAWIGWMLVLREKKGAERRRGHGRTAAASA